MSRRDLGAARPAFFRRLLRTRLRRNVVTGVMVTGGNLLVLAGSYPLYLRYLGYERYGVWLSLSTVLAVAQLGNLGISHALTKYAAEEHGRRDGAAVTRYASTGMALLAAASLLIAAVALLLRPQVVSLFKLDLLLAREMTRFYPAVIGLSVYVLLLQVPAGVLAGVGAMGRANTIQLLGRVAQLAASYGGLRLGFRLGALFAGALLSQALIHAASALALRAEGVVLFRRDSIDRRTARGLLGFGGGMLVASLFNLALHPLNRVIVARYAGIASVPVFEIAYTGAMQFRTFVDGALRPLMPEVSRLQGEGAGDGAERSRRLAGRAASLSLRLSAPAYACVWFAAPWLLDAWLGSRLAPTQLDAFRVMLLGSFASGLGVAAYFILLGLGDVASVVWSHALQTFVCLGLQLGIAHGTGSLTVWWSVVSVGAGMVVSTIFLEARRRDRNSS